MNIYINKNFRKIQYYNNVSVSKTLLSLKGKESWI